MNPNVDKVTTIFHQTSFQSRSVVLSDDERMKF